MTAWSWNFRPDVQALFDVILPVFLVLGAGYLTVWRRYLSEDAVDGLMRYAQGFAVPCLLMAGVARLDLSQNFDVGLLASFYAGALACFALGYAGARVLFDRPPPDAVAIGFCSFFSNTLLLGLPITERAYGTDALAGNYTIIAFHAPLLYTIGIIAMELVLGRGGGVARKEVIQKIGVGVVSNPLAIGIAVGLLINLAGNPLPGPIWDAIDIIARSALPTALFGLGGVLVRYRPEGDKATIAMICALSLIVHPAIAWTLGTHVFGLSTAQLRSAVVTAAVAPGVNAYLFANMYGVAKRVAATSVLVGTGLTLVTAWVWLAILP